MSGVRLAGSTGAPAPVLFLDLDDVLCMSSPYGGFAAAAAVNDRHANPQEVNRQLFQASSVYALNRTLSLP